jgi:hypothetical protein
MPTLEKAVAAYRQIRDKKKAIQDKHKEELAPLNANLQKLENWFLMQLNEQGADHVGTESGTVYKSTIVKPVVRDWMALRNHIEAERLWGLLEQRVSKTGVEEYMAAVGNAPPGVEITQETFARVRK